MARIIHFIGVACLFIAAILLLITTISAPVIGDIGILKVTLSNRTDIRHSSVTFGTFGHCVLDVAPVQTDQDYCYPKVIGYAPAKIMSQIDQTHFNLVGTDSADALTRAFILHPVACALAFIAAIVALGGVIGGLLGSMIAVVAWLITLVVMAIDFAAFGIIKNHVNSDGSGSHAFYSVGMWTTLAAMILLFFGMIIVFFTCCSERRKSRRSPEYGNGHTSKRHSRRGHKNETDNYANDGYANNGNGYANDNTNGYGGNGYVSNVHDTTTTGKTRRHF